MSKICAVPSLDNRLNFISDDKVLPNMIINEFDKGPAKEALMQDIILTRKEFCIRSKNVTNFLVRKYTKLVIYFALDIVTLMSQHRSKIQTIESNEKTTAH